MKDNMIYKDVFKCINCALETDEMYFTCPKCKEVGTLQFLKNVAVGPCQCADCIAKEKQRVKHFNHPFYYKAWETWTQHQRAQIEKGAEKYPEPFTPSSWTNEQLVEHAIQENVDQLHYIVGMKERMEQQEQRIQDLENQIKAIERNADHWHTEYKKMETKYNSKNEEYETLFEISGRQAKNTILLNREIENLKSENRTLKGEF